MARPKKNTIELQSSEDCTRAMGELLIAVTQLEKLTADRDQAVAKASAAYDTGIDEARAKKAEMETALRDYYMAHLDELERDGKRSVQLANGVMGRRLSPPRLALVNRAWTWAAVLVRLREKFGNRFLRLRDPEIDKDLVKAELAVEDLKALGMRVDQDETFYAEPERLPDPSEAA